jgi:hypothetical protein
LTFSIFINEFLAERQSVNGEKEVPNSAPDIS